MDALERDHGEVLKVNTVLGPVVLRGPLPVEYKRFRDQFLDEKRKAIAAEQLARSCVVFPSKEAYDAMVKKKPGISDLCGVKAIGMSGDKEVDEGKE